MSHNVYARITVTEEDKQTAIQMINDGRFEKAAEFLHALSKEIHIGIFSHNRRFKFGCNPEFYDVHHLSSIKSFLNLPKVQIYSETIGPLTPDKFWELVDERKNWQADRDYDNKITAEGISYKDCDADDWF